MTAAKRPKCASPKCGNMAHTANMKYCRKHAYAHGELKRRVDATMARQHLQRIISAGGTLNGVAKASGVDRDPLARIASGRSKTIRQDTHRKIMAVSPGRTLAYVPAWQITRRIRALRAAGWQLKELSERTGLGKTVLTKISSGSREIVRRSTAIAIRDVYAELSVQPVRPPTQWVARQHWAKPMEWDNIDDPDEQRDGIALGWLTPEFITDTHVRVDDKLIAKLDKLYAHYGTQKNLAAALGVSPSSITKYRTREAKKLDVETYVRIMTHRPAQEKAA